MQDGSAADYHDFSLIAKRNCSLRHTERWWAFGIIATVSVLIALAFASMGAWPILPFAGLELAALYAAFRRFSRDADDYEQVTIEGDHLVVECHTRGRKRRFEANRFWTQVVVRNDLGSCQIALRSQGREIEFGTLLGNGARLAAARQLRDQLRIQ